MARFRLLKSTTTLTLCVALAMPAPLVAQTSAPCGEGTGTPCPTDETAAEAEAQRQAEEAAAAEAQRQAEEAAAAEAQRQAEEAAAAEAQRQAEEEARKAAEDAAEAAAETRVEPAEQATDDPSETTEAAETPAEIPAETTGQPAETAAETPAETPTESPEVAQTDTEVTTEVANETPEVAAAAVAAPEASSDSAAAPAPTPETAAETVTETVTAETARSSEQEFDTRIQAAPAAQSDGGLSDFEKFALAGVGLVVLGSILRQNDRVAAASQDRVVVERDGGYYVIKDDDTLLRRPGAEIVTDRFSDGSSRTVVHREDGSRVETIRAANGQVLRRVRYLPDGRGVLLFDDTVAAPPVQLDRLPQVRPVPAGSNPELAAALAAAELADLDRRFSLQQVRQIRMVRELVPPIDLPDVTFESGSAAIQATEAVKLRELGLYMADLIARNPNEVFLIEGHTDATGSAAFNLALSDRRAESLALALNEYFDVPPENMVVQGYGEANLKIATQAAERANRRVAVRQITALLRTADID